MSHAEATRQAPVGSGVMILAGGTGGHIFPGLAVAEALQARDCPVVWMGTPHGLENRLVPAAGVPLERISIQGLRGRGPGGWLLAPFRILGAMVQARRILRRHQPGCVLSMGGYAAGPGGLMARLMGIPLVVHEQNAVAGLTNRILSRLARTTFSGFPGALKDARFSGNPVRESIVEMDSPETRYGTRRGRLVLLVIGGSQGADIFNRVVPEALGLLEAENRPVVVHQCGRGHEQTTRERYAEAGVEAEVLPFVDDMAEAWGRTDLAICRAGALTVAEVAAAGVASVLVPFPHAVDDHQTVNAHYLVHAGAAWLLHQKGFSPKALAAILQAARREKLAVMAARAREMARTDAAGEVARGCLEVMA